ncbi:hypothetical protein B0A48_05516 [Cryoendolithus antarcticus]|uniref:Uncharacterized protein n=1 Tax=Cryoendolithus antarcticus TaxID=1507870 RepID=A0A1V8TIR1_9PEZI|nr:hypothetical protein B0A48_05516 [Cryoendolithus antarcticus]
MALKLRQRLRKLFRRSSPSKKIKKRNLERRGTITTPHDIATWLHEQRAEPEVHELAAGATTKQEQPVERMQSTSEELLRPASAPAAQASLGSTIPRALSPARSVQLPSGAWAADVLTTLRLDPEKKPSIIEHVLRQDRHVAATEHDKFPSLAAPNPSGVDVDSMLQPADCVELESTAVVQSSVTRTNDNLTCNASDLSRNNFKDLPQNPASDTHAKLPSKIRKPRPASVNLLLPGSWPED